MDLLIDAVAHRLSPPLLTNDGVHRLRARGRDIPIPLAAGFELHMNDPGRADMGFCFTRHALDLRALSRFPDVGGHVAGMIAAWRVEMPYSDQIWIELDDDPAATSPGVFLRLPVNSAAASASVRYIGQRASDAARRRICVGPLATHAVVSYLHSIRWPGDLALVESIREICRTPFVQLQLETASDLLQPSLGIEGYCEDGLVGWHHCLDGLTAAGWIDDERRRALLLWIGQTTADEAPAAQRLLAPFNASRVIRGISHVKFALSDTGQVSLKAYISARCI